ncbi:MAG: hypothetical protein C0507_00685 [Cyanobacteria bacterium PR.3.49]|nr:hypothetical protein [Cyanobacteria bacterium PR.3.49]
MLRGGKPLLIKFLVTPVFEVLLPVINQKRCEHIGEDHAKNAKPQRQTQKQGKDPNHDCLFELQLS